MSGHTQGIEGGSFDPSSFTRIPIMGAKEEGVLSGHDYSFSDQTTEESSKTKEAASLLTSPKDSETTEKASPHKWSTSFLPTSPMGKAKHQIATRAATWLQAGARRAMSLMKDAAVGTSGFKMAGGVLSGLGVLAYAYMTVSSFAEAARCLHKKLYSAAAKALAGGLGAAAALLFAVQNAFVALKEVSINIGSAFLGTVGGAICAGLGPFIAGVLEGVKLKEMSQQRKVIEEGIKTGTHTKEQLEAHDRQMKLATMKLIGNILFAALQVGLAIGTGGISVGITLAISVAWLGAAYLAEIIIAKKEAQVQKLPSLAEPPRATMPLQGMIKV